jgi:hypothetical protein
MYRLIEQHIPIRGAIACGDYVRSNIGNSAFVAGRPIIEAYEYEQRQDWIGVMLALSAIKEMHDLNLNKLCTTFMANDEAFPNLENYLKWKAFLQECNTVPFHGDSRADFRLHSGFAIVPGGSTSLEEMVTRLQIMLERLTWLKITAPGPLEQAKFQHTMKWLRGISSTWKSRLSEYLQYKQR